MICRKCQMPLNGNEACNFCRSEYERIKQKNHEKAVGIVPRTYRAQIAYDMTHEKEKS